MDVRLVEVDQQVPLAPGIGQHALEPLDERLPSCRAGAAKQLLGLLPAQVQAMLSGTDGLAAAGHAEPLAHPGDQALERPAGCRVGAG
jgi:hypothetical protein